VRPTHWLLPLFFLLVLLPAIGPADADPTERLEKARARERLLEDLTRAFEAGDDQRVLRVLDDSLPPAELTARLWNLKGLSLARSRSFGEAIAAYEQGIRRRDDLWELHMNLGRALLSSNQGGRALAEFRRAVELAPQEVEARLALGVGCRHYRRWDCAREQLETAARLAPGDTRVLREEARLAAATGDSVLARRRWEELDQRRPSAETARNLARLFPADGDSALWWYLRCAERDSTAADCAAAAGSRLLRRGEDQKAVRWLRRADAGGATSPELVHNLLLAWQRLDQPDSVEALVARRPPTRGDSWAVVALSRRQAGDPEAALAAARRAVELSPENPDLLNIYGVLLQETGQSGPAREVWEKALGIDPGHAKARRNLEESGGTGG